MGTEWWLEGPHMMVGELLLACISLGWLVNSCWSRSN